MILMRHVLFFLFLFLMISCRQQAKNDNSESVQVDTGMVLDSVSMDSVSTDKKPVFKTFEGLADTTFVRLADFSDDFAYDMCYATENNFLKAKVYDCAECYTRVKTAKALIEANKDFKQQGVKIKFFDCYRPNSVQYKMWEIVPNPQYVANPDKGSIHNKGGAVDITLVDMDGKELDMGTDFDYFGKRAYHDNVDLPHEILNNRKLLKETMEAHGFWSIRTEGWHYNLSAASNDRVANFKWECPD